jgi:hypothetical protein
MANVKPQVKTSRYTEPALTEFQDGPEDKERLTQVLDRLLGELLTTSYMLDDLRSNESQARRAASRAADINRILVRL